VIYEIQQPSNVTFRLDDWGRVDAAGAPRPLHHDEGLPLVDPDSRPAPIPPIPLATGSTQRALLVATPYFALERIAFTGADECALAAVESPQALTCLAGTVLLRVGAWSASLVQGDTVVVPVGAAATLTGAPSSLLLRGWIPDLERNISAPARAAGASTEAIDALGVRLRL
jgi:mannose-6-phosphate isomerase